GLPRTARLLRTQRTRDPRHQRRLHRRHRVGQASFANPQQRACVVARLHPRHRLPLAGVNHTAATRPDTSRAAPLRNPNFRLLMMFRVFTILSYQGVAVTVGWHIYELTGDPWMLGLVGLAEVLP